MYELREPNSFTKNLKKLAKKYPKSKNHIRKTINSLKDNPAQGDRYPGFGTLFVRKMRIDLPEHKIGKSKGLRLLHLFIKDKGKVVPLAIYAKKSFGNKKKNGSSRINVKKRILLFPRAGSHSLRGSLLWTLPRPTICLLNRYMPIS